MAPGRTMRDPASTWLLPGICNPTTASPGVLAMTRSLIAVAGGLSLLAVRRQPLGDDKARTAAANLDMDG